MKKVIALLLASIMVVGIVAGCGQSSSSESGSEESSNEAETEAEAEPEAEAEAEETAGSDVMIGIVLSSDENSAYDAAHITGIQNAMANLGLTDDNVSWKYNIAEDESSYDAVVDHIEHGCQLIFCDAFGHQSYALQAAEEYPDAVICNSTGDLAAQAGLDNYKNYMPRLFEVRYVTGVVAGLKIKELVEAGKLQDNNFDENGNVKIGFVGAYPYAEIVSAYASFFLGVKSVYPEVSMEVMYTNSWYDTTREKEAAVALQEHGAVILVGDGSSTGPAIVAEEAHAKGSEVYVVGYNIDLTSVAPETALISAMSLWESYYTYAIQAFMNGEDIMTDWAGGFDEDAVGLTTYGKACAEGTEEKVNEVIEAIKDGSLKVFDTSTFTIDGEEVTSALADVEPDENYEGDTEAISDGYFHEQEYRSAPYFELRIDGITELN